MDRTETTKRAARLIGRLLIARKDVKAVEGPDHWVPVKTPFTLCDFEERRLRDRQARRWHPVCR